MKEFNQMSDDELIEHLIYIRTYQFVLDNCLSEDILDGAELAFKLCEKRNLNRNNILNKFKEITGSNYDEIINIQLEELEEKILIKGIKLRKPGDYEETLQQSIELCEKKIEFYENYLKRLDKNENN